MTEPRPRTEPELIELIRSSDVRAPDSLHRQVQALVAAPRARARRGRFARHTPRRRSPAAPRRLHATTPRLLAPTAVAAAVVAIALAVGLSAGGSPAIGLRQAAAPTLRAATLPAPPDSSSHRAQLAAAVDGVPFPYWEDRFGWRSTGARTDRVGDRAITTVFYTDSSGRRIGYAILAGSPAPRIGGGTIAWRHGVPYRLLSEQGAAVVTWVRDGRMCVVSGRGVSSATLLRLASWSEPGARTAA